LTPLTVMRHTQTVKAKALHNKRAIFIYFHTNTHNLSYNGMNIKNPSHFEGMSFIARLQVLSAGMSGVWYPHTKSTHARKGGVSAAHSNTLIEKSGSPKQSLVLIEPKVDLYKANSLACHCTNVHVLPSVSTLFFFPSS
jgi:hypothetical protein